MLFVTLLVVTHGPFLILILLGILFIFFFSSSLPVFFRHNFWDSKFFETSRQALAVIAGPLLMNRNFALFTSLTTWMEWVFRKNGISSSSSAVESYIIFEKFYGSTEWGALLDVIFCPRKDRVEIWRRPLEELITSGGRNDWWNCFMSNESLMKGI